MKRNVIIIGAVMLVIVAAAITLRPSKEARRAAIERAFQYDSQIADERISDYFNKASIFEIISDVFIGESSTSYRDACSQYAARLKSIPLDGCPLDFKKAYKEHIAAWESYDKNAIKDTWYKVKIVAYSYGVAKHE